MERRRPRLDPLLVDQVNQRLEFVLADRLPRRAQPAPPDPGPDFTVTLPGLAPTPAADEGSTLELGPMEDLPAPSRFTRRHLAVLAVLVVVGLLGGGWGLLRARPVVVAGPAEVVVSTPAPPAAQAPPVSASPTAELVVHVLGAVRRPGLVSLPPGSRVQDAIRAAGGLKGTADPGELNLAQLVADGEQIVIGRRGKPAGEVRDGGSGVPDGSGGASPGATLDLNRATAAQLEELPGVGPVTAGKIVAWRTEHSRFSRVQELQEVDGIGPKTYAQIAPHVRV